MATSKIFLNKYDKLCFDLDLSKFLYKTYLINIKGIWKYKYHACNTILLLEGNNKFFILKIYNKKIRENQLFIENYIRKKIKKNNIIIPKIILTLNKNFYSLYKGRKSVLYNYINSKDFFIEENIIKKFSIALLNFHENLTNDKIFNYCIINNFLSNEFNDESNFLFRELIIFFIKNDNINHIFDNKKIIIIKSIIYKYYNFFLNNYKGFIYGGLNKDHLGVFNNNIVFYDMESIGIGNKLLDILYSAYYLGYRNNHEIFEYNIIKDIFINYNKNYIYKLKDNDFNIIILYFMFNDLKIMLKQKDEFPNIKIYKHFFILINYYKQYIKNN